MALMRVGHDRRIATPEPDILRSPEAGGRVIRGGAVRAAGYGVGVLLGAVTATFLLRYLGVVEFGRFMTVAALLGIVSGVTDAGLTTVGNRELALRPAGEERRRVLGNLVTLRLIFTPVGVVLAALFALAAGYDRTLVLGTLVGGLGVVLVNAQATAMQPLSVGLRFGSLTAFEVAKHALTLAGVALLVALRTSLLPFFAVQAVVGALVLAATPRFVGGGGLRPRLDRALAATLVREALPLAAALAMSVVYFRVLVILTSMLGTELETGLFATSFRVFEVLFGLPLLVLSVALPVLSVAGSEDPERLRFALQRMTEVALAGSLLLVLVLVPLADPIVELLGGDEYDEAGPVLAIQALALVPVFLGQTWQLGLVALRRQADVAVATGIALVAVVVLGVALIPRSGAEGAAVAAVLAETLLGVVTFILLVRARRDVAPRFGFALRLVPAAAAGALVLLAPLPAVVVAVAAGTAFVAAALVLRAFPPELLPALRGRR
jgi:O-antigen/teichoic acid export membrane protein